MRSFFERRDPWGHGLARYVLLLLVLFLPVLGFGVRHVHFDNDIRDWLPSEDQDSRILDWHDEHFQRYDNFLISWDDSTLNDPRIGALTERLQGTSDEAGHLSGKLPGVQGVTSPPELIDRMMEGGITQEESIKRLSGVLIGTGFLKVRLTDAGRGREQDVQRQLVAYYAEAFDGECTILPPVTEFVDSDPRGNGDDADGAAAPPSELEFPRPPPHDFQLRWPGIHPDAPEVPAISKFARSLEAGGEPLVADCFFWNGAPVALFVRITPEGSSSLTEVFHGVRDAAKEVGIDPDKFHKAGTPVGQWQLDVESSKSIWNRDVPVWRLYKRSPFLMSGIVGMVVAFLLLRSMRLATLVLFVSVYTALTCVLLVPLAGQTLNIVLSVMPNLLLVLTASGVIHVANYWRHAVQTGSQNPIADAVKVAWKPCAMATLTTAIGMASLMVSTLVPVRDFGMYSALGVLLSLLMILYGFPSVLAVLGGLPKGFEAIDSSRWRRFGMLLGRHHVACSAGFAVVFALGVFGLRYFHTETKAIRYFPPDTRIVHDYNTIEESLAGVVTVDTVIYFDRAARERMDILERIELVRAIEQKIQQAEGVSGTLSLADFREPTSPPPDNASTVAKLRYRTRVRRTEQVLFGEGSQPTNESESSSQLVCKVEAPLRFARAGMIHLWPRTGDITREAESAVPPERPENATHADASPQDANEVWQIRAQTAMMTDLNYGDLVDDLNQRAAAAIAEATAGQQGVDSDKPGVDYVVTGMVPLFLRTQQEVIKSLIKSFGLAFVAIALTMIVLLRSVTSGLMSMLPNVWPTVVVFGAISLCDIPVDIGTMITASVAMGIAVDGTVHLLTWFRNGILEGYDRHEATARALAHCGPALWQTSATIALAMLMTIFSDLLLISRFGWIMSAAVSMALFADIALTPALLAGPLGGLMERSLQRQRAEAQAKEGANTETPPTETVTVPESAPQSGLDK
jgi:uncharacterized protein